MMQQDSCERAENHFPRLWIKGNHFVNNVQFLA